jgi:hypothetical protein
VSQTSRSGPPLPTQLAFVVQFAAETAGAQGRFVGRVEHVVSGQVQRFHTLEDLLGFMVRVLQQQRALREEA